MPRVVDPGSNPVTVKSRAALSQRGLAPGPPLRPVAARRVALSAVLTRALRARIRESTLICPSASSRPQRRNLYACLVRGRSPVFVPAGWRKAAGHSAEVSRYSTSVSDYGPTARNRFPRSIESIERAPLVPECKRLFTRCKPELTDDAPTVLIRAPPVPILLDVE